MEESAKTLIGSYVYARVMLLFRINPRSLQARLPAPWELASLGDAWRAHRGVNLAVGFCDVLRAQDAAGTPAPAPSNRYIPFNGPCRNTATGEMVNMWYRAFAVHPDGLLGWGRVPQNPALPATFSMAQTMEGRDLHASATERYDVRPLGGGAIELEVEYQRSIPKPYRWSRNIRNPADPSFGLHYVNAEMRDDLRSVPEGIDRVRTYRFRVAVPELADLFDGTEELVAITSVPWSERRVFRLEDGPEATA